MRLGHFSALALVLVATTAPTWAADLTPLFPDRAWMVLGVEVKAIHQSPLGKKVFGTDAAAAAAGKLLAAFGNRDDADSLKGLAPLHPVLDRVTRLTAVTSEGGEPPASDDFRIFLEGDFDDSGLGRALEGVCKRRELPYKTETVGGRTVHVTGAEGRTLRVFRLDKNTVAVVCTPAAVTDVLDRQAGKKKSKAPKAVVEAARGIDPAATPIWLVVGENRTPDGVNYVRMVATVALGADATLRIRQEAPDAAAAARCREMLNTFATALVLAKDYRLLKDLGFSAKFETTGTLVTATAVLPGKTLAEEYAKQK